MQTFIAATDIHGIEQDKKATRCFRAFCDGFDKKAIRICLGDLWNFAALRRQADEHEKVIRLKEDFEAGLEFLEWFRPSILLLGNHDQRLWDCVRRERVNRTGWLSELAGTYVDQFDEFAAALDIKVLPYDKRKGVYRVGGLAFAHGFGSGDSLSYRMARTYGNVVFGHGHKIERVTEMHGGRPVTGYQIGCLCNDDMEYTRSQLTFLRQEQGWAYGVLGRVPEVFQARVVNGKALVMEGFKEV